LMLRVQIIQTVQVDQKHTRGEGWANSYSTANTSIIGISGDLTQLNPLSTTLSEPTETH